MYDPQTRGLIQAAPPLVDLDLERLPEIMTKAYADIVSLRLRVRELGPDFPQDLATEIERFRRLANTYEGWVALVPEEDDRAAAAFVAASAHHLVYRGDRLRPDRIRSSSELARNCISSDVSAMLLFLIAGYQADASEMAKQISVFGQGPVEVALLTSLRYLAEGALDRVLIVEIAQDPPQSDSEPDLVATRELYFRLYKGVQALASVLLGQSIGDPIEEFRAVQTASRFDFAFADADLQEFSKLKFVSAFPGPHQLATLLIYAGGTLLGQSVITLPAPKGLDGSWPEILRSLAKRRPYLWPNHWSALQTPMLDPGKSAVISLPTGAGKTTLAELKIATALASGKKVVYLAPTHALADQVRDQLKSAFPEYRVAGSAVSDGFYAEIDEESLPPLMVMTPERCLTLLGVLRDEFCSLGLVVFDECHLLHPRREFAERRNVDAALCLLKLFESAPSADYLFMSAMVSNFKELAGWLSDVTQRPAVPIGIEWKPTRQARGCLVFREEEVNALAELLKKEKGVAIQAEAAKPRKRKKSGIPAPGAAVKRQLVAKPLGFFCLRQTWTLTVEDYSVLPLSDATVPLMANANWFITPNKNAVAADLGAKLAALGIKTLVFIQNKGHCESVASGVAKTLLASRQALPFTAPEQQMFRVASEETGGKEAVIGTYHGLAACHHGLLLPIERHLTESMFCRKDGPALLTATPTLAQGMNLPAEVVIIAGDMRREKGNDKAVPVEAHELLNAAGRAGRAGHVADGVVLVIPEDVVSINTENNSISRKWLKLNESVFGKSDQCLDVDDPISYVLDLIHATVDPSDTILPYVVRRLPRSAPNDKESGQLFLRRSLAAYRARRDGRETGFDQAVMAVLNLREKFEEQEATEEGPSWLSDLSVSSGISRMILANLESELHSVTPVPQKTVSEWVSWFFEWITKNPAFALQLFDCSALNNIIKMPLADGDTLRTILPGLLGKLASLVHAWMNGATLRELEKELGTPENRLGTCDRARELVIRRIPEISYALGLITQVHRGLLESEGHPHDMPLNLGTLAACVREGLSSPIDLAVKYVSQSEISRKGCHDLSRRLGIKAQSAPQNETFRSVLKRVRRLVRDLG